MAQEQKPETRPVRLVPHDSSWPERAAMEQARILPAIRNIKPRFEHIGSTSVPGLLAKPIIDLLIILPSITAADARRDDIEALGYAWRGEAGIPGRRYCTRDAAGQRIAHIHMFARGAPEISAHLDFRNHLRAHPDEARAYEDIKLSAAAAHPEDSFAYSHAKADWITACVARARRDRMLRSSD